MQAGKLEWVAISDENAGLFDDLLLGTAGKACGTQIKTEENASSITLNTQLIANGLFKKMARSWDLIEKNRGRDKCVINFIFGGYFSTNDSSMANKDAEGPLHSAEFVKFLNQDTLTAEDISDSKWSCSLKVLRRESELSDEDFISLLNSLRLETRDELIRHQIASYPPNVRPWIEQIRVAIPRLISKRDGKVNWTEDDLIAELGWRRKLRQANYHRFPVPDDFQANEETRDALLASIAANDSGYIALVGPPGTGKSTLLQQSLFSTQNFGVARYLAFVPNERYGLGRAEAGEFLNDLTLELHQLGFSGSRYASDNLNALRQDLGRQLDEAAERWRSKRRKTVIIIDGLDHVPREENPDLSFLTQLPATIAVPKGVLFVLGTQHLELDDLHATIRQQLQQAKRRVQICELSRSAIFRLADASSLPSYVSRDELYQASSGHPLTARYLINALSSAKNEEEAAKILSFELGIGQEPEEIYERVWQGLGVDDAPIRALGLLARAESSIRPEDLAKAVGERAVETLIKSAGFLFAGVQDGRLSLFHNSFRLFVVKSTQNKFGRYSEELERGYHEELAEIAKASPQGSPQHRLELRYRARASDQSSVLSLGTPEYFRELLREHRPSDSIYIDLRLVFRSVKPTRDRNLLLEKLLIAKEIEYRLEAVSNLDMVTALLEIGEQDRAFEHAISSDYGHSGWIDLCDDLWSAGEYKAAKRVFDANEPLEELFSANGIDARDGFQEIQEWVRYAPRFRPLDEVVSLIKSVEFRVDAHSGDSLEGERRTLLLSLALGLLEDNEDFDAQSVIEQTGIDEGFGVAELSISAAQNANKRGKGALEVRQLLEVALSHSSFDETHRSWRWAALKLANDLGDGEMVCRILDGMAITALDSHASSLHTHALGNGIRTQFGLRYLAAKYGASIDEQRSPTASFLYSVEHYLTELAQLRLQADIGDDGSVSRRLDQTLSFFAHASPGRGDTWSYKYYPVLSELASLFLKISDEFGNAVFGSTVSTIDRLIASGDNNLSGSRDFRLAFAIEVYLRDRDQAAAESRINSTVSTFSFSYTPHEAVEARAAFSRAYSTVGCSSAARAQIVGIHEDSLGYWLAAKKEPQYQWWDEAYIAACKAAPERASEFASEYGRFVFGLCETEGSDTAYRVAPGLLKGSAFAPPVAAALIDRCLDQDLTNWSAMIDAALLGILEADQSLSGSCIDTFSQLVVPFAWTTTEEFLPSAFSKLPESEWAYTAQLVLDDISRWCPTSQRADFAEALNEASGRTLDISCVLEQAAQSKRLIRDSQSQSIEEDDEERYEGMSLFELVNSHKYESQPDDYMRDYRFARAATRMAEAASISEIKKFLSDKPSLTKDVRFMGAVARRAHELGDEDYFEHAFKQVEYTSYGGHWSEFMGGEKLCLQELRVLKNEAIGRDQGFDILLDDLASGRAHATSLFLNLGRVLGLITVSASPVQAWEQTQRYLQQFREYRQTDPILPDVRVTSPARLLGFILSTPFKLACPPALDHARIAIDRVARREGTDEPIKAFIEFVEPLSEGPREIAAFLLRNRNIDHLKEIIRSTAERLLEHADFVVSSTADFVLRSLGEEPSRPSSGLPPFYELEFPEDPNADDFSLPPGSADRAGRVWVNAPWFWTTLLRFPIRMVHRATQIEVNVLRRRCASFMTSEGGAEAFGPPAEKTIEDRLGNIGMEMSYRRPLPMAANRAIGRVLGELDRANSIDPDVFEHVWMEIGGPSRVGFATDWRPRPMWIEPPNLPMKDYGSVDSEAWIENVATRLFVPLPPDRFVLAERSHFLIKRSWDILETFRTLLPSGADWSVDEPFESVPRLDSVDRWHPLYQQAESRIVSIVPENLFGDLREATLTICPYVCRHLGWKPQKDKPFSLVDGNGNLVAETISWIDGSPTLRLPDDELYGVGQVVLLTYEARNALETLMGPIEIHGQIRNEITSQRRDLRVGRARSIQ